MYIVAIAWLWVAFMMAIAEHSVVAGVMTFLFYGLLPATLIVYLMGTPARRRRQREAEQAAGRDERPPPSAGDDDPRR